MIYSKVSDLEDFFYCLDAELEYVISPKHPPGIQIQRACELSNACVTIIRTCFNYKNENENHLWYPPPEGLTPWYCLHVVRKGIWSVASILLQLYCLLYVPLEEEVMKHLHSVEDKQPVEHQLLHPEDLIKLCLKSEEPELSLWAFDVFAWTSSSFRKIHRKLLEDCWKKAASEDDWSKLHETSVIEGWSEEETQENLKHTILFQASSRCYGPRAETYGEGFDQVLPLRQESLENPIPGDMNSSVETILMQHKDFGDAGKLMLMAIMLGTELDGDIKLEGGPSPME